MASTKALGSGDRRGLRSRTEMGHGELLSLLVPLPARLSCRVRGVYYPG